MMAQAEYDGFMTDSKVDKESDTKDIEHKAVKKQDKFQVPLTHAQRCARCLIGYAAAATRKESDPFPSESVPH
eukprot:99976-Heterocapsa_arctica.AAC.2